MLICQILFNSDQPIPRSKFASQSRGQPIPRSNQNCIGQIFDKCPLIWPCLKSGHYNCYRPLDICQKRTGLKLLLQTLNRNSLATCSKLVGPNYTSAEKDLYSVPADSNYEFLVWAYFARLPLIRNDGPCLPAPCLVNVYVGGILEHQEYQNIPRNLRIEPKINKYSYIPRKVLIFLYYRNFRTDLSFIQFKCMILYDIINVMCY